MNEPFAPCCGPAIVVSSVMPVARCHCSRCQRSRCQRSRCQRSRYQRRRDARLPGRRGARARAQRRRWRRIGERELGARVALGRDAQRVESSVARQRGSPSPDADRLTVELDRRGLGVTVIIASNVATDGTLVGAGSLVVGAVVGGSDVGRVVVGGAVVVLVVTDVLLVVAVEPFAPNARTSATPRIAIAPAPTTIAPRLPRRQLDGPRARGRPGAGGSRSHGLDLARLLGRRGVALGEGLLTRHHGDSAGAADLLGSGRFFGFAASVWAAFAALDARVGGLTTSSSASRCGARRAAAAVARSSGPSRTLRTTPRACSRPRTARARDRAPRSRDHRLAGLAIERTHHHVGQPLRHVGVRDRERLDRHRRDAVQDLEHGVAAIGRSPASDS